MTRWLGIALLLLLILVHAACGGRATLHTESAGVTDSPPTPAQLEALLEQEFDRLGIDPARVTAAAASGSENAVFDLSASLIDPDGPPDGLGGGELPPTGIALKWTERHQGDYDGNGIVAVNDLTPIGLEFQSNVSYDDPALHGGLKHYPSGDPDDTGTGAANWALARVDGNSDGKVSVQDLTPIAVHYQQRIYGYRVYRRGPSDSGFVLQQAFSGPAPSPGSEDSFVTLPHPAIVPAGQPVRYAYENGPEADGGGAGGSGTDFEPGVYQFYVVPWDSASNTEGQRSPTLSIDIETGMVNQGPVASLTVTPDFAGAPAVITLDASDSFDPDGASGDGNGIAEYRWDLDGDGVYDYSSLDPEPPESSSKGTVTGITPGPPGPGGAPASTLTATYIQGSEAYYLPTVRVLDSAGLLDSTNKQLGISGWEIELLNESLESYKLGISIELLGEDPNTGELVAVGRGDIQSGAGPLHRNGLFFARRHSDGTWTEEQIVDEEAAEWKYEENGNEHTYGKTTPRGLAWDSSGQPTVIFYSNEDIIFQESILRVWSAQRRSDGVWEVDFRWQGLDEPNNSKVMSAALFHAAGSNDGIVSIMAQSVDDPGDSNDLSNIKFYYMLSSAGEWPVTFSGYQSHLDGAARPTRVAVQPDGQALVLFDCEDALRPGLWGAHVVPGEELVPFRLDSGDALVSSDERKPVNMVWGLGGVRYGLYGEKSSYGHIIFELHTGNTVKHELRPLVDQSFNVLRGYGLHATPLGPGVFLYEDSSSNTIMILEHAVLENGNWLRETVEHKPEGEQGLLYFAASIQGQTELWVAFIRGFNDSDFKETYFLGRHLDPRKH